MTKTLTSSTRALFVASLLSAPLLLGADGGCSGGQLPIGGDRADSGAATGGSVSSGGSSASGGGPSSSGGSSAGPECTSERQALLDFLEANKACASDDDCSTQYVGCGVTEDDCTGAVYVNDSADPSAFGHLREAFVGCAGDGGGCAVCLRASAPPACVSGSCQRAGSEPDCSGERAALVDFIQANKACEVDDDCTSAQIGCDVTEDGCTGAVFMSRDTDFSAYKPLEQAYLACAGGSVGGCAICDRAIGGGDCQAGRCVGRNSLGVPDLCRLATEVGPCDAAIPRYTYNGSSCVPFEYGGCEGNANNFETLAECEAVCGH